MLNFEIGLTFPATFFKLKVFSSLCCTKKKQIKGCRCFDRANQANVEATTRRNQNNRILKRFLSGGREQK